VLPSTPPRGAPCYDRAYTLVPGVADGSDALETVEAGMGVNLLEAIVAGNAGISLTLLLLVGVPLWRRRRKLAGVWRDPDPRWRSLARLALAV
jgi:uncharacterized protein (TIGR03382 family)